MKTLEEIVNEQFLMNHTVGFQKMSIIEVMKEYARQVAEQALKDASENATMLYHDGHLKITGSVKYFSSGCDNLQPNRQSILQTEIKTP